jgi:hypothetical protein
MDQRSKFLSNERLKKLSPTEHEKVKTMEMKTPRSERIEK